MIPFDEPSWSGLTKRGNGGAGLVLHHRERGRRDPVVGQRLLGARLVEAERQREGVAAAVRHAEELADRRHVRLAVHAVQPFRDVEDDVGALVAQPLGEVGVGLEPHDGAERRQRAGHGVDRRRRVPLGVHVHRRRRRGRGAPGEASTGRLFLGGGRVGLARERGGRGGGGGLQVVGESDARHPLCETLAGHSGPAGLRGVGCLQLHAVLGPPAGKCGAIRRPGESRSARPPTQRRRVTRCTTRGAAARHTLRYPTRAASRRSSAA